MQKQPIVYIVLIITIPMADMCVTHICEWDSILCEEWIPFRSCTRFKEEYVNNTKNCNGVFKYNDTGTIDLRDALPTNCATCDEKLKKCFKRVATCYLKHTPEKTKEVMKIYDPDGLYVADLPDSEP